MKPKSKAKPRPAPKPKQRRLRTKPAFLAAFRIAASITEAAKACTLDRSAHYEWLRTDAKYAAAFALAKVEAGESLEDEAVRRAKEGVLRPIFYQGKAVGAERVYSDTLMICLLGGFMPAKYRRDRLELVGKDGGAIEVSLAEVIRDRREKREAGK